MAYLLWAMCRLHECGFESRRTLEVPGSKITVLLRMLLCRREKLAVNRSVGLKSFGPAQFMAISLVSARLLAVNSWKIDCTAASIDYHALYLQSFGSQRFILHESRVIIGKSAPWAAKSFFSPMHICNSLYFLV